MHPGWCGGKEYPPALSATKAPLAAYTRLLHRYWDVADEILTSKILGYLGGLRVIVLFQSNHPDSLLDTCIAFGPRRFRARPLLPEVESTLVGKLGLC